MNHVVKITFEEAIAKRHIIVRKVTTWTNPLRVPQRLEISLGPVTPFSGTFEEVDKDEGTVTRKHASGHLQTFAVVEIGPGESKDLPREWDSVIHRVHNGVVIGGQAPQLRRAGQTERIESALVGKRDAAAPSPTRMIED